MEWGEPKYENPKGAESTRVQEQGDKLKRGKIILISPVVVNTCRDNPIRINRDDLEDLSTCQRLNRSQPNATWEEHAIAEWTRSGTISEPAISARSSMGVHLSMSPPTCAYHAPFHIFIVGKS